MTLMAVPDPAEDATWSVQPPHDPAAEQATLGAMLLSSAMVAAIAAIVAEEDFYRPAHQIIYATILALHQRGDPVDAIAVHHELTARGHAARAGGAPYLHTLTAAVPTPGNGAYYARIVAEYAQRRAVVAAGSRLVHLGHSTGDDVTDLVDAVRDQLDAAPAARDWPDPLPLGATHRERPEFPLEALPDWVGQYAAAVADATQTPPDLAGCLGLACLSTAASGRIWVDTGQWREPACVYTVVAMPPASRKSAVFAAMCDPITTTEEHIIDQARPAIIQARLDKRVADARAEELAAKAENERTPTAIAEAARAAEAAAELSVPHEPRLLADDITPENLARRLAEQGGRLALLAPEGGFFGTLAGRYSSMPNLDTFLKAHAGESIRVDRQGRPSDHVDHATLTIGITLQPEVLREVFATPGGRGRGLLARILYALPADNVGYRNARTDPIPSEVATRYRRDLSALLCTLRAVSKPHLLTFTPQARIRITELLAEIEPQLRPDGQLGQIRDWAGKHVGAVVRIAALLHLGEHLTDGWGTPITTTTLEAARTIGAYYADHARAVFDAMSTDTTTSKARTVLDWLTTKQPARFTVRDAFNRLPRGVFARVAELRPALDVLEEHGWIRAEPRPQPTKKGGRPPSPTYQTHPHIQNGPGA